MSRSGFSRSCQNARALISQELDQELSEIRRAALRAHLRECAACVELARELDAVTSLLRAAPLEQPPYSALVLAPARRGIRRPLRLVIAAAMAVAASTAAGALVGITTQRAHDAAPLLRAQAGGVAATQEPYLEQHLLAMLARAHPPTGRVVAT